MNVEAEIRELLSQRGGAPEDASAPLDLPSLEVILLAEDLEARFDLRVKATDLSPENFGTLRGLVDFVTRGRSAHLVE